MKHLSSTSWLLSAVVLLCGCGGGVRASAPPSSPPSGPPSGPPTQGQNISGNWQISTTSTALPGIPPATIVGSITQSDSSVSGVVHVDGWTCFDPQIAVGVTGTLTDGDVSLTSTSVDGQVITFAGSISKKTGFRVRLLLADLMADKEYQDKVATENLSFLRTDRAFEKCMQLAYKKWRWVQKKLGVAAAGAHG